MQEERLLGGGDLISQQLYYRLVLFVTDKALEACPEQRRSHRMGRRGDAYVGGTNPASTRYGAILQSLLRRSFVEVASWTSPAKSRPWSATSGSVSSNPRGALADAVTHGTVIGAMKSS